MLAMLIVLHMQSYLIVKIKKKKTVECLVFPSYLVQKYPVFRSKTFDD